MDLYENVQEYLGTAEPLTEVFSVNIVSRGKVRATLYGESAKSLYARAERFVEKIHLEGAEIIPQR